MQSVNPVAGGDNPRVLLIDDDVDERLAVRSALDPGGWTVNVASTAGEAIAAAQRCQPDVIVLDLDLPDGNGRAVLAELKSSAETERIPIVVLSTQTKDSTMGSPLREGAQDCIQKPFSPDDLEARVAVARRVAAKYRQAQPNEEEYRRLCDLAADAVMSIDAEGIVTFANAGATTMLGREEDQIVGRQIFEFMDGEGQAIMTEQLRRRRSGRRGSYQNRLLDANGLPIWVQLEAIPRYDPDGSYTGSLAIVTNVTSEHVAEQSLRTTENKYRSLFVHGPAGMAEISPEGRFVQVNPTLSEMFGYSAEELHAMTLVDICHPDDEEETVQSLANMYLLTAAASRMFQQFSAEKRYMHASGRVVWCSVNASATFGEDGRLAYILVQFLDITEKKETERSLASYERRWKTIFDLAPVGLAEVSLDGHFMSANPATCEMVGYSADELALLTPVDVTHPDDRERVLELITEVALDNVADLNYTGRFIDARGQVAWCTVRVVRIHGADGDDDYFLAAYLDITDQKEFERQLEDMASQANEGSQLKSNFLANMSHEIRTPMNGIMGMAELLLETDLNDVQRDYAQTVQASGAALITIINDVLDYSKIEAGKVDVEEVEFSVESVVDDVLHLLTPQAETKGLKLVGVVSKSVPGVVRGDPLRVRQVLFNLVGNAIKFTQAGEISVSVTEFESLGEDVVLQFEIADTGHGIEPDRLDEIFHPFVQADMSTSRKYGGTGLGLSISSQLVGLMGGDCGVSSQLGIGSTFWFTVCVRTGHGSATKELTTSSLQPSRVGVLVVEDNVNQLGILSKSDDGPGPPVLEAMAPQGLHRVGEPQSRRLLLAEDNLINQKVAVAMLSSAGYQVDTASNGAEVLQKVVDGGYNAVLMDCQMPVLNGYDATSAIRALKSPVRSIAIIGVTAGAREEDRLRCVAAGMDAYIAKPFTKDALIALVACIIDRESGNEHEGDSRVRSLNGAPNDVIEEGLFR